MQALTYTPKPQKWLTVNKKLEKLSHENKRVWEGDQSDAAQN